MLTAGTGRGEARVARCEHAACAQATSSRRESHADLIGGGEVLTAEAVEIVACWLGRDGRQPMLGARLGECVGACVGSQGRAAFVLRPAGRSLREDTGVGLSSLPEAAVDHPKPAFPLPQKPIDT